MQISTDLIIQFNVFTVFPTILYKNSHELIKNNN